VENLDELSIDQLHEKVIAENWALLERTLEVLEQIANKVEQRPEQEFALLLLAQPLQILFDVRRRQHDVLQASWGLWQARGFFDKRLQAKEERVGLMQLLADHEKWRKTLRKAEESLKP
jgi:hypothetical protein